MPRDALLAVAYWVLLGSVTGYFLLTWGNSIVDPSMVGAYFTVQPIGAVVASMVVIAWTPGSEHFGLQGPGIEDVGALAIFFGVGLLILDARQSGERGNAHGELRDRAARASEPLSHDLGHDVETPSARLLPEGGGSSGLNSQPALPGMRAAIGTLADLRMTCLDLHLLRLHFARSRVSSPPSTIWRQVHRLRMTPYSSRFVSRSR